MSEPDSPACSESILVPQDALDELGITAEELAEAMRKSSGEIVTIPRLIRLTTDDIFELLRGGTVCRHDVEIELDKPPSAIYELAIQDDD